MARPDKPMTFSRQAHRAACCDPVFHREDRQGFEVAEKLHFM